MTTSLPPPVTTPAVPGGDGQDHGVQHPTSTPAHNFEEVYRTTVGPITAYFARRTRDPQLAADLTADTFTAAITSFTSYRPSLGSSRQWMFGIARRVFAQHLDSARRQEHALERLRGYRPLQPDESSEVTDRIDAERAGRSMLASLKDRPTGEREAAELVLLADLTPREAATVLGITPGAVRVRLLRARRALRAASLTAPSLATTHVALLANDEPQARKNTETNTQTGRTPR